MGFFYSSFPGLRNKYSFPVVICDLTNLFPHNIPSSRRLSGRGSVKKREDVSVPTRRVRLRDHNVRCYCFLTKSSLIQTGLFIDKPLRRREWIDDESHHPYASYLVLMFIDPLFLSLCNRNSWVPVRSVRYRVHRYRHSQTLVAETLGLFLPFSYESVRPSFFLRISTIDPRRFLREVVRRTKTVFFFKMFINNLTTDLTHFYVDSLTSMKYRWSISPLTCFRPRQPLTHTFIITSPRSRRRFINMITKSWTNGNLSGLL